ncbi:ArsC/Spx/MgsR family protein [Magnetospirillum sp. UT-4]|uniref:ArsC/Spx/MgsR family protein n=1 Tax=Magnetospirillum sp. UT-4 TaxID=2681467 RepID=UPI00137EBBBD|nr:ArsC/Spx/MgsR family protein [Magnetospirillum sp. UT-4]CAA7618091.1 Uncharacterized 15.7 kDa protein in draG 3'region [Magnetospirillum sp. UT-4]
MALVIFYEKPGCGGNARQKKAMEESGHQVVACDLLSEPWTADSLMAFLDPLPPAQWFNRAHPRIKAGEVQPETFTAEAALALLLAEPLFIRRPLLQVGDARRVGWDEAAVEAWIGLKGADVGEGCPKNDGHTCP